MASTAVREVIALAAELSENERRIVVDAIAPRESLARLAQEWEAEIARRAERVRSGQSRGKPADEVFDRLESNSRHDDGAAGGALGTGGAVTLRAASC
jgi:hypothetical protein